MNKILPSLPGMVLCLICMSSVSPQPTSKQEQGINETITANDLTLTLPTTSPARVAGQGAGTEEINFSSATSQQSQCPPLSRQAISGSLTATVSSKVRYAISRDEATKFTWRVTSSKGVSFTGFSNQGTNRIVITWPSTPDVYRISVTYSTGSGCPTRTAFIHTHVIDPAAGYVTGEGWSDFAANKEYELMQTGGRMHWKLKARYKEGAEPRMEGGVQLENDAFTFRSTSLQAESMVITDNRAYFRGRGHVTYKNRKGGEETDPREFGFLISGIDGQLNNDNGKDKLRIKIWLLDPSGSRLEDVFDSQVGCRNVSIHYNVAPCTSISEGNFVIHKPEKESPVVDWRGLKVYPTVFSDHATILYSLNEDSEYDLSLYDAKGALVKWLGTGSVEGGKRYEQELRAEGLAKGLYLLRLTTPNISYTEKLVIDRQ